MQILKEDVRKKIIEAARKTFKKEGYAKSSIRKIAIQAEMSSGNLYRYYKNKEALFEEIVRPSYEIYQAELEKMKKKYEQREAESGRTPKYYSQIEAELIQFFKLKRDEMNLLFNYSEGSQFASAEQELEQLTYEVTQDIFMTGKRKERLTHLEKSQAKLIARYLIHGLADLLNSTEDQLEFEQLIDTHLLIYSTGLKAVTEENR
ncbi:TetR/AcrR family transcriptional regulator [Listeria aquatica]|uniref:Transcriptional regulator, TetR family protein n=1 Tax=Listeria aquatica FSL S10-1188 TaxID=1265818 RepID=W7B6J8_9LIST|nr:TetR/AcrR family transcriptional regulator [Listeria aquatica]EUJ18466.1 transcriptional regulator, TetR family protein [Listeria aquatica FSL S10-1188]